MIHPILSSKVFIFFKYEPDKRLVVQSQQLEHVWIMFTVSNKDAIVFIQNLAQFSHLILVLQ